jgi:hypothetical protein
MLPLEGASKSFYDATKTLFSILGHPNRRTCADEVLGHFTDDLHYFADNSRGPEFVFLTVRRARDQRCVAGDFDKPHC